MDLRLWHLHLGMDLSFIVVSGLVFLTTERTVQIVVAVVFFKERDDVVEVKVLFFVGRVGIVLVDVAVGVIEVSVANNIVKRVYVERWLLTDASLRIRRIFIRISI